MLKYCSKCLSVAVIPSRLKIIELLKNSKKDLTVNDVVHELMLRQPTVTFHINKLVEAGIVTKKKVGREALLKLHLNSARCKTCPIFD